MSTTTLEFESHPNEDGSLPIPPGIAAQLKGVESVRVLVVLPIGTDEEWAALTREQFLKGYADTALSDKILGEGGGLNQ